MATFNLSRNTRVFLTHDVDQNTGVIPSSGTITTTGSLSVTELAILDGFSFSQASQSTTVSLNEAGDTPVRGQRSFNTALDPVEFSFSTYLGPNGTTIVDIGDRVLWNAMLSKVAIELSYTPTVTAITRASNTAVMATITHSSYSYVSNGVVAGDIIQITSQQGTITTAFQHWCGPVKIVSFSPSASAATSVVVEYQTPPPVAAGNSATVPTVFRFYKSSYIRVATSTTSEAYGEVNTAVSNTNQLVKFGLFFNVDNATYAIDNCVIESATIDFGLDGIATVVWTGKGAALRLLPSLVVSGANPAEFTGTGGPTGTAAAAVTGAHIANKLSTVTLTSNIQGASGTSYSMPITGGSITITNNATYLVPAALRTVNTPITYSLGARAISGNLTAYLRTGSGNTAQLLTDIIAQGTEPKFAMVLKIGGATGRRVEVIMNAAVLQVPSIETGDVVSTAINFTAQGFNPLASANAYDMERTNDLVIRAYGQ